MKVYVCEVDYGYDGTGLAIVYDNKEKAEEWEKACYNLRAEWIAYQQDWEEQNNPEHKMIRDSAWSTDIGKYYLDEFEKLDSDRYAEGFQYREMEVE